jgi:hypothetical protein
MLLVTVCVTVCVTFVCTDKFVCLGLGRQSNAYLVV